jgi:microsomal dipeptidase-like Zn-dependent dipeptidase
MGSTNSTKESQEVIGWHLKAIEKACGDHAATAIGTDIDGFVKPTLAGFGNAPDLKALEAWIRANSPREVEAILHGNARRVLKQAFTRRAQGPRVV